MNTGDFMKISRNGTDICLTIDEEYDGYTILAWLNTFKQGKKQIHHLRMSQQVKVNGQSVKQNFNYVLRKGDELSFPFFIPETPDFQPQDVQFNIVYEDEFLLIVDKPAGLLVHPSEKTGLNTLVNGISAYYHATNQPYRVRYLHRLDVETSGLIIFVKQAFLHAYYDDLLRTKQVRRNYLAICCGKMNAKHQTIETYLASDRHQSGKRRVAKQGEFARTHIEVLDWSNTLSLVRCTLDTGRTHQIRVHLSHIGHPLLGDKLYNPKPTTLIQRHALHAYEVEIPLPFQKEAKIITSPLPQDMAVLMQYFSHIKIPSTKW